MMPRFLSRRAVTALAVGALAVGGVTTTALTVTGAHSRPGTFAAAADLGSHCVEVIPASQWGPGSCAHADVAPSGVDVTKPVPTSVLEARSGAAAAAVEAAQEQGVPVAATVAATTDRVPCDGDGTSGYRVQAVYVVTADKTNRFGSVGDQIKQWAAGVDSVFNLSAAKTGGVRDVRFVTATNADGTCSPTVLNVTLPAGSNASFNSTITAMENAGYVSPARKYLMWVDGTGYCGIAQTYLSSGAGQDNPNNGAYPQFARIDTGCWGGSQSVEAHELSHTLGSVQGDAPHATKAGHCWDESDRMCYSDGGGFAMKQVCAADQEVLFDCNDDDYYSTYPPAGSYLATHWNTANSRFLIGGGDGVGGGTLGVPTRLGGTLSVNNPAVPGLPTQVAVNLEVPTGRTTTTTWTTTRADCVFGDKTATQTTVTCDAKTTTAASVTVTVTDSAGDKIVRTSALTFDPTARAAQAALTLDTTTGAAYTACPTGKAVLSAKVLDQASGVPVKGVPVGWFRTVGATAPVQVATATTGADGVAKAPATVMSAGAYTVKTIGTAAFGSVTSAKTDVTVAASACPTALTATADATTVQAGQPVHLSGTLTRTLPDGTSAPAAGESVTVYAQAPGASTWTAAGTAQTGADGTYAATLKPVASVTLQARLAGRAAYQAATAAPVAVTVVPWATVVSVTPSVTDLMAGAAVTVTGTLTQSDGTTTSGLAGAQVTVTYPLADGKTATAGALTNAAGTYTVQVRPTGSGTLTVRYAGKPGWPAATASTALTVHEWTTVVSVAPSVTDLMAGTPVTVTGTLTQSDGTTTSGLAGAQVAVTYPLAGGKTATAAATTGTGGKYSVVVRPTGAGNVTVRYAGKPGWVATSVSTPLNVHEWASALAMSATRNASTGMVSVTGTLTAQSSTGTSTPKAFAPVQVTYQYSATKTVTVSVTTTATGQFTVAVKPGASGNVTAHYAGVPGWSVADATPVPITVP